MKSDINFKKKLFKILFIKKKTLIKVGNKALSQRFIKKNDTNEFCTKTKF